MPTVNYQGRVFEVDNRGFLINPGIWDREVASLFAEAQGVAELTEQHWQVLAYIRQHFESEGKAPLIRSICNHCEISLRDLYTLFPKGPVHGACKIAGLDKPEGCV